MYHNRQKRQAQFHKLNHSLVIKCITSLFKGYIKLHLYVHTNWYLDVYYNQTKSNNIIYISTGLKLK